MSFQSRLRKLLLCCALQLGVLAGTPMRPEQIEELLRTMRQTKVVRTLDQRSDKQKS